ncbi:MAG: hypothetical protein R2827_13555 [Bdellovibrionales bacterium]
MLYGVILGFSKKQVLAHVDEIHEFSGLNEYFDVPFRYYSSGMMSRLGFSVVSKLDPELLLVDEVLAVGDYEFGAKCKEVMHSFKKKGKTIIVVSHSAGDIEGFCERAIWIEKGEVKRDGDPTEILNEYMNRSEEEQRIAEAVVKNDENRISSL